MMHAGRAVVLELEERFNKRCLCFSKVVNPFVPEKMKAFWSTVYPSVEDSSDGFRSLDPLLVLQALHSAGLERYGIPVPRAEDPTRSPFILSVRGAWEYDENVLHALARYVKETPSSIHSQLRVAIDQGECLLLLGFARKTEAKM
jgi:hypothetical protein